MAFEMVDREIWLFETDREAFRDRRANHKRARQTRAARRGKRVYFADADFRMPQCAFE